MKLFSCQCCDSTIYFDNEICLSCGSRLGYLPHRACLSALREESGAFTALADPGTAYVLCANAGLGGCNWLVPAQSGGSLCAACRHNRTLPDLSVAENVALWRPIELAKRQVFYSLLRFKLPLRDRTEDPEHGLAFDFLSDAATPPGENVLTGHDNGLITLNIAEADDAEREKRRSAMGEPYRTLIGHFRHEIGHYVWDLLVANDGPMLDACRALFGDERADYGQALQRHYAQGAPAGWQASFISTYATAHPWEDFAETFAHYLHMVDALETAAAFGLKVHPKVRAGDALAVEVDFDPYAATDAAALVEAWVPLTVALNSVNRSMGQPDLYPFILSEPVVRKLQFIRDLLAPPHAGQGDVSGAVPGEAPRAQPAPAATAA